MNFNFFNTTSHIMMRFTTTMFSEDLLYSLSTKKTLLKAIKLENNWLGSKSRLKKLLGMAALNTIRLAKGYSTMQIQITQNSILLDKYGKNPIFGETKMQTAMRNARIDADAQYYLWMGNVCIDADKHTLVCKNFDEASRLRTLALRLHDPDISILREKYEIYKDEQIRRKSISKNGYTLLY